MGKQTPLEVTFILLAMVQVPLENNINTFNPGPDLVSSLQNVYEQHDHIWINYYIISNLFFT